jgi:hypothetical protein
MLVNVSEYPANVPSIVVLDMDRSPTKNDSAETYVVGPPSPSAAQFEPPCASAQGHQTNKIVNSPRIVPVDSPVAPTEPLSTLSDSKETYVVCPSPERMADVIAKADSEQTTTIPKPSDEALLAKFPPEIDGKANDIVEHSQLPVKAKDILDKENRARRAHRAPVTLSVSPPLRTNHKVLQSHNGSQGNTNHSVRSSNFLKTSAERRTAPLATGPRRPPSDSAAKASGIRRPPARSVIHKLTLIRQPRGSGSTPVRNPNHFASKNIYYDERWVEKQTAGLTKWLNYVLTPEDGETIATKHDVAKLWRVCTSEDKGVPRAPTREVLSMRAYSARRQLNRLRRLACVLWQTPEVATVVTRMEVEVEKKRFMVRHDKSLNRDVGMKRTFLELVLTYHPLWLRLGLETIFGELIPLAGTGDVLGLSRFVLSRMLTNPAIESEFAHPTVPHHYRPGFEEALKAFTLKKFFQLVFFLDKAKEHKLIVHDPCLFCKDGEFKVARRLTNNNKFINHTMVGFFLQMSKDLLLAFSRDFLAGEGNVLKHLAYFGYEVKHKQTPLDEFDFSVTNLAVDLVDGIRLW